MAKRIGVMAFVLLLGTVTGARGNYVHVFHFAAEGANGRTMAGWYGIRSFGGATYLDRAADISISSMDLFIALDGVHYFYNVPRQFPGFHELTIVNSAPGQGPDIYDLWLPEGGTGGGGPFPRQRFFQLTLTDRDGTAFSSHFDIPRAFDLDQFEGRFVAFDPGEGGPGFGGRLTSLIVPEPSSLGLCGIAAVGVGLAAMRHKAA